MFKKATVTLIALGCVALLIPMTPANEGVREFSAAGGKLILDLEAGGTVEISGTGGSSISVAYTLKCTPDCDIEFDESGRGLKIRTRYVDQRGRQSSNIYPWIQLPRRFDVELDARSGGRASDGVDGRFNGMP